MIMNQEIIILDESTIIKWSDDDTNTHHEIVIDKKSKKIVYDAFSSPTGILVTRMEGSEIFSDT